MRSRRPRAKSEPPVAKATTIKDVAEHLGIAHSTVSRALNDHRLINAETKKRVRDAAAKLGYIANQSARAMRRTHSGIIGLVLPSIESEPFFVAAKILAGHCRRAGYQLLLAISDDDPRVELGLVEQLREARVAGIIIAACPDNLDRTVELLRTIPAVQWMRRSSKLPLPTVGADDRTAIHAITTHLLQMGHQRIAFIGGPANLGTAQVRRLGFCDAMTEARGRFDESLLFSGPLHSDFARISVASLLQRPKAPTAIVCGNSTLTLGVAEALTQAKVDVPTHMSFTGYGDPAWFRVWGPGITTVSSPLGEVAEAAATLLMQQIGQQTLRSTNSPVHVHLRHTITLRGTTQPPFDGS